MSGNTSPFQTSRVIFFAIFATHPANGIIESTNIDTRSSRFDDFPDIKTKESLDKIVEGFGAPDNLLYGPEIKFYSNKLKISNKFETSIKGLYSIGDGGGMTRGLMMASCSGVKMARIIEEEE